MYNLIIKVICDLTYDVNLRSIHITHATTIKYSKDNKSESHGVSVHTNAYPPPSSTVRSQVSCYLSLKGIRHKEGRRDPTERVHHMRGYA